MGFHTATACSIHAVMSVSQVPHDTVSRLVQWDGLQGRWIESERDESSMASGMHPCYAGAIPGGIITGMPGGMNMVPAGGLGLAGAVPCTFPMPSAMPCTYPRQVITSLSSSEAMMLPASTISAAPYATMASPQSFIAPGLESPSPMGSLGTAQLNLSSMSTGVPFRCLSSCHPLDESQQKHSVISDEMMPGWCVAVELRLEGEHRPNRFPIA